MNLSSRYLSEDTIAAVSTAIGGAISVIRISGPKADSALSQLIRRQDVSQLQARKLYRFKLYAHSHQGSSSPTQNTDVQFVIDDALIVRFPHPKSYTGETLIELHLHGGGFIAHRVMETLSLLQVRQALPGEFSFRAVRNGKMSLFQAQAVADLISASNDQATSLALEKMSGFQNQALHDLSSGLRTLAALGEVGIDFSDQNLEEVSLPHLKQKVLPYLNLLKTLKESFHRGIRLQDGIRVAFIGLPNAGKSSFFNALLGEERSIVSEMAGTTRDIVCERLTLRGKNQMLTLRLEDTAGMRVTHHPVEKMGIQRTWEAAQKSDLILLIIDPAMDFKETQEQWSLLNQNADSELSKKTIAVLTKKDQLSQKQIQITIQEIQNLEIQKWTLISSLTGEGISESVDSIIQFCECWTNRATGEILLTRKEHFQSVTQSIEHLERSLLAPEIELYASDLRHALHSLGPLIGETLPDTLLDEIFSKFCIGK